jgi:Skp family chaperone for outer membrane proteins
MQAAANLVNCPISDRDKKEKNMKLLGGLLVAFLFLTINHAVRAQTAAPFAGAKVAVINSGSFYDEKVGITKLVNAIKGVNAEFKPEQDKLIAISTRIETLAKEIQDLQTKLNTTPPPPDANAIRTAIAAKTEEGERLQLEFKRRQEDAKQAYEKRSKQAIDPISTDIGKAIDLYAKARGIDLILDLTKLAEAGAVLALSSSVDVTDAFIKDYNAKNAGVPVK